MMSFIQRITRFFSSIFSFGRRIFAEPFFDHVFAIAGLVYPPAAPIIEAIDRLFEQESQEGLLRELDSLLAQSGLDSRQAGILRRVISLFLMQSGSLDTGNAGSQKAALAREILKTAIASNVGDFRSYGVSQAIEKLYGLRIRGVEDREHIPDHLVNFSLELAVCQRKFNRLLDQLIAYACTAIQPLIDADPGEVESLLQSGRERGLWTFTLDDYQKPETRKRIAALLTKEEAIEEGFTLWGQPVHSIEQVPDFLVNLAVEACYANSKLPVVAA